MRNEEMLAMLVDYMGKGFLENIIALFKTDPSLFELIPSLLTEENIRVRLGTAALVEELAYGHRAELRAAVPGLIGLLKSDNPNVRGDAAYVLGVLKDAGSVGALRRLLEDTNPAVQEIARDALEEIRQAVMSPECPDAGGDHHA